MEPQCQIKLEAFEGPLDLLLHLIQKNKIDVSDLPIALITAQYLEYLEFMRALDIVVAGEYLVMAATLLHIKSRTLLPRPEPQDPDDDPRLEIARPLKELIRIREAAEELGRRPILGRDVFLPEVGTIPTGDADDCGTLEDRPIQADLMGLIDALKTVISARNLAETLSVARARVSMAERIEALELELSRAGRLSLFEFISWEDLETVIVTFLALLELVKQGKARVIQKEPGGDIHIFAIHPARPPEEGYRSRSYLTRS